MDLAVPALPAARRAAFPANRLLLAGLVLVALLCGVGLLAPLLAPHDPDTQFNRGLDRHGMPLAPSRRYVLGTDQLGRDVLSRTLFGARISLSVGLVAMLTALGVGVSIGLAAGFYGRTVDGALMRFTDVMLTIPALLLAIAFAGLMDGRVLHLHPTGFPAHLLDVKLERGMLSVLLVIGLVTWTTIARVVRAQVLSLREREFITAARSAGAGVRRILWRHVLPNVLPAILVLASMTTAATIGLEAGLSYLGVGVPPPAPSWGSMIAEGQAYLLVAPWLVLPPGLAVILAVVGFNLLGQGLQDTLDPFRRSR